jgi:hypothetical protein
VKEKLTGRINAMRGGRVRPRCITLNEHAIPLSDQEAESLLSVRRSKGLSSYSFKSIGIFCHAGRPLLKSAGCKNKKTQENNSGNKRLDSTSISKNIIFSGNTRID